MNASQKRILYMPLDERPCNYIYPQYIARIGGADLDIVPQNLLGHFKQPADTDALWDWVFEHAAGCDAMVLSMDMLLYGGIVPSRLHHLTDEVLRERQERLRKLRAAVPNTPIYAFQLITRAPARNGSGEEPDYYEQHGYDIFRYGVLSDKESIAALSDEESQEKQDILTRVPADALEDFLARRRLNFECNRRMLRLFAEGIVDHLVIPLDDCFTYGYAPSERRRLSAECAELGILSKIAMYPGADEMGCTLVSRALCNFAGFCPSVWVDYSSQPGRLTAPAYEDRPICETAPHHILCAGAQEALTPQTADIALLINPPTPFSNRIKFEMDRRKLYMESDRNFPAFLHRARQYLDAGLVCAVADCAIPDGADECLMQFLCEQKMLERIHCFSGWNTSSNALGTALAHAVALACSEKLDANPEQTAQLSAKFRTMRILEDWAYMTHVRQDVSDQILTGQYPPITDVRYLGDHSAEIANEVADRLRRFAAERLGALPYEIGITLPWDRMFEIDLTLQ